MTAGSSGRFSELGTTLLNQLKRALGEFLALPLAVVLGFIAVTATIYWADSAWSPGRGPSGFAWLGHLLGDSASLATLLGTIASSIITVTSITFSLLLIAVQQGSSALTTQVTDQFLMRRSNQLYFGYFVGLSVFALLSLVTASSIHRPVFGTTAVLLLTVGALCMMVVLIYNTIDQMRPTQIVRAIHQHVLRARDHEVVLLAATRRHPRDEWPIAATLRATATGHIVSIDAAKLKGKIAARNCGEVELELCVPIGRYLAFGDPLATLRRPVTTTFDDATFRRIEAAVTESIALDDARNLRHDPAYGISQLAVIAWTSISTAKSNPSPGQAVIESLRDILSRWSQDGGVVPGDADALVVIDAAAAEAIAALEDIAGVTSESMQASTLASTIRTLAILLPRMPVPWQNAIAEVARRLLSSLGEHVLTRELEAELANLVEALRQAGFAEVAADVGRATATLRGSLGALNSRSTRVPTG